MPSEPGSQKTPVNINRSKSMHQTRAIKVSPTRKNV